MEKGIPVKLTLEDGSFYTGKSFGAITTNAGEVVFNTAMTGYPENLTDPSNRGQILCLTYPLIGNYGAPATDPRADQPGYHEPSSIHISGLIVSDYSFEYSHWNAGESLSDWLDRNGVPGIYGIDTRALAKKLREKGSMLGKIEPAGMSTDFSDPNLTNLVKEVSTPGIKIYGDGRHRVILIDCGVKQSIMKNLLKRDTKIIKVPWDYDFSGEEYDGLVISNGPGDPQMCQPAIMNIKKSLSAGKPIFGICLGNLLLALAAGARTYKLKSGHRSHNQPVLRTGTNKACISSQNHGFAVDSSSLPADWEVQYINLNDGSNEGIMHKTMPFFSTQFHPKANDGATDTDFLFDDFIDMIEKRKGCD